MYFGRGVGGRWCLFPWDRDNKGAVKYKSIRIGHQSLVRYLDDTILYSAESFGRYMKKVTSKYKSFRMIGFLLVSHLVYPQL